MSNGNVTFTSIVQSDEHGKLLSAHRGDGLWHPPNQNTEPELHSIWQRMNEVELAKVQLDPNEVRPEGSRPPTLSVRVRENLQRHLPGRLRKRPEPEHKDFRKLRHKFVSSHNWSGAIVPALGGRRFTCVAAQWEIPALRTEPSKDFSGSMISIWIGLGGWYPWSNSMPHMGTEHGWDDEGKHINRVWCQWWLGQNRKSWLSEIFTDVKIEPGDSVMCYLVASEKEVEFHFFNTAKERRRHAGVRASAPRAVIGSSAEWIVERPMRIEEYDKGFRQIGLYPIPPIGEVEMHNCAARLGPASDCRRRTLDNADLIRLIDLRRRGVSQERWPQQALRSSIEPACDPKLKVCPGYGA